MADEGEDHLDAAIRELEEETGFEIHYLNKDNPLLIDLGEHSYAEVKNLHMFYMKIDGLSSEHTKVMQCRSMVLNTKGPDYPEMDAFAVFEHHKVASKLSPRMLGWIKAYVPKDLLEGVA